VLFGIAAWLCGALWGWTIDDILQARDSTLNFVSGLITGNIAIVIGWLSCRPNASLEPLARKDG